MSIENHSPSEWFSIYCTQVTKQVFQTYRRTKWNIEDSELYLIIYIDITLPGDKVRCIPAKRFAHNEVMGSLLQASLCNVVIY